MCAWALYVMGSPPPGLWERLVARLRQAHWQELDEATAVYCLQCALQQASLEAAEQVRVRGR